MYIHIVSTVADSAVSVSWSLSRATLFATSYLLAITVIHVRPSSRTGQRAPLDDIIIMGGTGDVHVSFPPSRSCVYRNYLCAQEP